MHRLVLPVMGLWLSAGASALASDLFWNVNPNNYVAAGPSVPVHVAAYQAQRQDREGVDPRTYERAPEAGAQNRREPAPRQFIDREPRREAEPAREYIDGPPPGETVGVPQGQSNQPIHGHHDGHCGHIDGGCEPLCCEPLCGMTHDGCHDGQHNCTDSLDRSLTARLKMAWWRVWHPHYWFRHPHADLGCHHGGHDHCGHDMCGHNHCGFDNCDTSCCDFGGCGMEDCFSSSDCGGHVGHYGGLSLLEGQGFGSATYPSEYAGPSYAATDAVRTPATRQRPVSRYDSGRRYSSEAASEELPVQRSARPEASDSHPMMIEARPTGLDPSSGSGPARNAAEMYRPLPQDVI